ncbi:PadR family transcriptional regulator [Mycobacterium yunnanensis]|uniref:PadR family transcriptional regulator n=1 Tax=Mycobacterium yunnanensis TaxID=368477 RepID=A0A9X2Z9A9_9MYCO|nr:PadR family transcriptional regulator [Mycobacterium yunnanensis]MCV7424359.1 PadR family transcriptional regulator [Mycobacterium yunnanensis]
MLKEFVDELGEPQYGYKLMQSTGFSSAKTYQILARLTGAGWLTRHDDPGATPESGGPPRITYTMRPQAVPRARTLIQEAQEEFSPAPKRRRVRNPLQAFGWTS